jgi:signal peptide peptidase SppA
MNHLGQALSFALSSCWALEEGFHRRLMAVLQRHSQGIRLSEEELTAATGRSLPRRPAEMRIEKGTAVIPIHGVIAPRAGAVGRTSSNVGTSVEHIRADLTTALGDDSVRAIVLDVDSPGGSVGGIQDLADDLRRAREHKPIIAHTDGMMASAAYWLASQADQVLASPGATVGSIGVIASFLDDHRAAANEGLDPVVVKSTPAKGGIQSNGTFSDADRADLQREVNAYHALFIDSIAAGRRITRQEAAGLGDGRLYIGQEARRRGLVDAVGPFSAALLKAVGQAR